MNDCLSGDFHSIIPNLARCSNKSIIPSKGSFPVEKKDFALRDGDLRVTFDKLIREELM